MAKLTSQLNAKEIDERTHNLQPIIGYTRSTFVSSFQGTIGLRFTFLFPADIVSFSQNEITSQRRCCTDVYTRFKHRIWCLLKNTFVERDEISLKNRDQFLEVVSRRYSANILRGVYSLQEGEIKNTKILCTVRENGEREWRADIL